VPWALGGIAMSLDELVADEPFDYRATKNGLVYISYKGRTVTTLRGRESSRFLSKVESGNPRAVQLAMAKATGHFKHGTERVSKNKGNHR
jgi:hypothetical protein